MKRSLLTLCALAATATAHAQPYPSKPVQVVIPWTAGGGVDAIGRAMSNAMGDALGQQFVIVNRDGAAGTIGTAVVATSKPDGYTLGFGPVTPITNAPHLMAGVTYTPDSFVYVCQVFENAFAVAVPQDSPFKSLVELVKFAEANPGKLSYGHLGIGSQSHLSMQNIISDRKLVVTDVPYKGDAAMLPDLQTGRLAAGSVSVQSMIGRPVRLLAVFADARQPSFPDAPTVAETGLPTMPAPRNGFIAPRGTPPEVLQRLESACEGATKSESVRTTMQRLSQPVVFLKAGPFTDKTLDDYRQRGTLIRALGLSPK